MYDAGREIHNTHSTQSGTGRHGIPARDLDPQKLESSIIGGKNGDYLHLLQTQTQLVAFGARQHFRSLG